MSEEYQKGYRAGQAATKLSWVLKLLCWEPFGRGTAGHRQEMLQERPSNEWQQGFLDGYRAKGRA